MILRQFEDTRSATERVPHVCGGIRTQGLKFSDPEKKTLREFFAFALVTELHSKEGEAPKRGLWAVRSTGPPSSPGRLFSRSMTGGGPVDTAVTSACPLLKFFIPRPPVCNGHIFCPLQKNGRYTAVTWGILMKTCADES